MIRGRSTGRSVNVFLHYLHIIWNKTQLGKIKKNFSIVIYHIFFVLSETDTTSDSTIDRVSINCNRVITVHTVAYFVFGAPKIHFFMSIPMVVVMVSIEIVIDKFCIAVLNVIHNR